MSSLRIEGKSALDEGELRAAASGCIDPDDCAAALEVFYAEKGYVTAAVTPSQSRLQRWLGSRSGTLSVVEGPRFVFGDIRITEAGHHDDALGAPQALAALVTIRTGDTFDPEAVRALMVVLQRRYQDAGYEDVVVVPVTQIDTSTNRVAVTLEIERGVRSPSRN